MDSSKRRPSRRSAPPKPKTRSNAAPRRSSVAAASSPSLAESPVKGALRLLPYQQRWVTDASPLKIAVKARQIGYSFAATLRAVLVCLERKTTWIFLSKGERQSRLLMEKVADHVRSMGLVARALESSYFEGTQTRQLETRFPNGSVIYGLPANPDTARGYSGHVTLDEFAFHADAAKIYSALFPTITRGFGLEVISTPNGTQGKFYELAKAAGLIDVGAGLAPAHGRPQGSPLPAQWSGHHCDIYEAVRQGLRIDIGLLRSGCEDETAWQQEFCCAFVSTAENFFPPELLAACLSAEASTDTPPRLLDRESESPSPSAISARGASELFLGIDVGRRHDRTVFWIDEVVHADGSGRGTSIARMVRSFRNAPFAEQMEFARELLSLRGGGGEPSISRVAIDATGIGLMLAESLAQEFGPRVEPVVFTAAVKEDLAFRARRRMEERLTLLPDSADVRRAFSAVKKFVTPTGNLRFDAARTDAGHSDEFWAKALADYAADFRPRATASDGFLAGGAPIINPRAFAVVAPGWKEIM